MADGAASLLITGGRVMTPGSDPDQPQAADILIEGDRIAEIRSSQASEPRSADQTLDASGKLIVAGFVNAHYHSHDVFLKGCFEPSCLELWVLNALPRNYRPRSDREVRLRTLLGAIECLRGGITTVQDMLTLSPLTAHQARVVADTYREAGLRAVIGLQIADVGPLETTPFWNEEIPDDLKPLLSGAARSAGGPDPVAEMRTLLTEGGGDLVRWGIAPSSPERCSRALLDQVAALADETGARVFCHIYISRAELLNARSSFAEDGGSMVRYLERCGLLGPNLTLAHGVWLDTAEIEQLADAGASLVINPLSNLKTKNGVAPVRQLIEMGVPLGIGCDNSSCSDAQNIFQAMKLFTLIAAVTDPRPGPPSASDALAAATAGGARALGLENKVGALSPGMLADLTLLSLEDPAYVPLNSATRQIVFGEGGRGVDTVIVGGQIVMQDQKLTAVDEESVRAEIDEVFPEFIGEARSIFSKTEQLRPHIERADRRIWAQPVDLHRYVGNH